MAPPSINAPEPIHWRNQLYADGVWKDNLLALNECSI